MNKAIVTLKKGEGRMLNPEEPGFLTMRLKV